MPLRLALAACLLCAAATAQPFDRPLEPAPAARGPLPDTVQAATRAEALREARRDRLAALRPPEQSALERRLLSFEESAGPARVSRFLNGPVRPAFGGAGVGAGLAAGVSVHAFPRSEDKRLSARVVATLEGTVVGRLTAGVRPGPWTLYASATAGRLNEERLYTPTPDGGASRQTYELAETEATGLVGWRPVPRVLLAATGGWARYDPSGTAGIRFLRPDAPGLGSDQQFGIGGARLVIEGRDVSDGEVLGEGFEASKREKANRVLDPAEGVFLALQADRYHNLGGEGFSFTQYTAEAQGYLDLRREYNVLAVRATATYADPDGGDAVPFYLQPALGGPYTLRGFDTFRFRDNAALALTAEYRWRVWRFLDLALFGDAGQVAPTPRDFDLGALEYSYGAGARIVTRDGIFFRLDVARSEADTRLILRFDHAF